LAQAQRGLYNFIIIFFIKKGFNLKQSQTLMIDCNDDYIGIKNRYYKECKML